MRFKKYRIILSTKSGGYSEGIEEKILEIFEKNNLLDRVEIFKSEYPGHIGNLAREFSEKYGSDGIIYGAGGDGTFQEIVNEIRGSKTAFGIIPMGTANDFSKCLKINSIENIVDPTIRDIDLLSINDFFGINIFSFGFDTLILKRALEILKTFPKLGETAYTISIIRSLFSKKSTHLEYSFKLSNGETVSGKGEYMIIALCNGSYYGGGYNPAPGNSIEDGVFEVVLIEKMSIFEMASMIPKYKAGKHLDHRNVKVYKTTAGEFKIDRAITANIDGNLLEDSNFSYSNGTKIPFAFY